MSETVHQEQTTQTAAQPERTFTQAEMDAIIGDRLNRERQKYADYAELKAKALKFDEAENASKTELQKATEKAAALEQELNTLKTQQQVAGIRAKVAQETGVPAALLYGDDEATCKEQGGGDFEIRTAGHLSGHSEEQGHAVTRSRRERGHARAGTADVRQKIRQRRPIYGSIDFE